MKYRAEIDGLRAIAVVPVILFHAGLDVVSGGFVGVDVFFVISGFLITTILINDIENDRFSILNFYERRARRILPALVFTLLLVALIAWAVLTPIAMLSAYQQLVSNAFFVSNIHYTLTWGYFESWKLPPVFLNTWSLAVEEQFYLLIPFLIYFLRNKIRLNVYLFVFLTCVSLAWASYAHSDFPVSTYYLLPSRLWELNVGVLLAYLMKYKEPDVRRWRNRFSQLRFGEYLLLIALLTFYVVYSKETPYPSVWTVPVVLLAALLILLTSSASSLGRALSIPALVYIGKLSYPLYLLHFPLIILSKELLVPRFSEIQASFIGVLFTCFFSLLVYHLIESKFRAKVFLRSRNSMLISSSLILIAISLIGFLGHTGAIESRLVKKDRELSKLIVEPALPNGIGIDDCAARNANTECLLQSGLGRADEKRFLIIGDSFAADLISPLWQVLSEDEGVSLKARITYSCSYMPSGFVIWEGECGRARQYVDRLTSGDVSDVIFHVDFIGHMTSTKVSSIDDELISLTSMFDGLLKRNIGVHVLGHRDLFNMEPLRAYAYPWLASELISIKAPEQLEKYYDQWSRSGVSVHRTNAGLSLEDAHRFYRDSGHLSSEGGIDFIRRVGIENSEALVR